jgi:hypothetical protein
MLQRLLRRRFRRRFTASVERRHDVVNRAPQPIPNSEKDDHHLWHHTRRSRISGSRRQARMMWTAEVRDSQPAPSRPPSQRVAADRVRPRCVSG